MHCFCYFFLTKISFILGLHWKCQNFHAHRHEWIIQTESHKKDQSFLMWNPNRMNLGICNTNNWPLQCPSFNLNISTFKCVSRKGRKITINSHELSQSIDSKWNQTFFFSSSISWYIYVLHSDYIKRQLHTL